MQQQYVAIEFNSNLLVPIEIAFEQATRQSMGNESMLTAVIYLFYKKQFVSI